MVPTGLASHGCPIDRPHEFPRLRRFTPTFLAVGILGLVAGVASCHRIERPATVTLRGQPGGNPDPHPVSIAPARPMHGVQIENASGSASVPCATCHQGRSARSVFSAEDLDEFHQGLVFAHGRLACAACHDPVDYGALRLADGTRVPYGDPMPLCRQCHGSQARDYDHGAHGGWTGYWDLRQGPRVRNHCVHCHDPHAPSFPRMQPTFKPHDRFLDGKHRQEHP